MKTKSFIILFLFLIILFSCCFSNIVFADTIVCESLLDNIVLSDEVIAICDSNIELISNSFDIQRYPCDYTVLGDCLEKPTAILVTLNDENQTPSGYMIFDYNSLSIKEFDFSYGETIITVLSDIAKDGNGKVIYQNQLAIEFEQKTMMLSNNYVNNGQLRYTSQTNPITSPMDYKSYTLPVTTSSSHIKSRFTGFQFVTTSDFSGYDNHCAPTAGTNIAILLKCTKDNTAPYLSTFEELYRLMHTNFLKYGTLFTDVRIGLTNYLRKYGKRKYNLDLMTSITKEKIKGAVETRNPFHVSLSNNGYYGDHAVVGIGWYQIVDSAGVNDLFIRVLDGWSTSTYRYVYLDDSVARIIKIKNA